MKITPKDWREFQHYKDRSPPWIRLHKKLLDNYEFHCLPVASRALAPMLWLLASDSLDGLIDASADKLAFRLRMTIKEVETALKPLIDNGFFVEEQDASGPLADRKQVAVPETETETETEADTRRKPARQTTLPADFSISERVKTWALANGHRDLAPHFDALVSYAKRKAAKYADWDEALMTAIRDNWGKTDRPAANGVTVPLDPSSLYQPTPKLTDEQIEANRVRAKELKARVHGAAA